MGKQDRLSDIAGNGRDHVAITVCSATGSEPSERHYR